MRWLLAILLTACAGAQSPAMHKNPADVDQDGVLDVDDQCAYDPGPPPTGCPAPTPPASRDSVIEQTGTGPTPPAAPPAGDRDGDGIPDAEDRCPDEPEADDGRADRDGCPG